MRWLQPDPWWHGDDDQSPSDQSFRRVFYVRFDVVRDSNTLPELSIMCGFFNSTDIGRGFSRMFGVRRYLSHDYSKVARAPSSYPVSAGNRKGNTMNLIKEAFLHTADWRREKAEEFPDDNRNIAAAELLEKLAAGADDLQGTDLERRYFKIAETTDGHPDGYLLSEAESEALK
jgi:hypothetical protein